MNPTVPNAIIHGHHEIRTFNQDPQLKQYPMQYCDLSPWCQQIYILLAKQARDRVGFAEVAANFSPDRLCGIVVAFGVGRGLSYREALDVWNVFHNSVLAQKFMEKVYAGR